VRRPIILEPEQQSDHAEALLKMIFGLSTNFISLPPDDVDDGINDVLKAIGTFARVDRSGVFQFGENGDKAGRTHEWSSNGAGGRLENVSAESLSWLCGRIRSCEVVHISDVWKLPAESARERDEFRRVGLRSIVAVPIVSGYSVMGFIEFESLHEDKVWSENIISLLKIVGEIFAFALSRKRIAEALKQSESKYKALFEHASEAILLVEGGVFVECNPKGLSMFACTREQIIGRSPIDFSPPTQPDGRDSREELMRKGRLALSGTPQFFEWKHRRYGGTLFDAEISFSRVELGKRVFLQAMVRDVTDRKQAEEKLASTLENLRKAMGGTIEAIVHVVETKDPYTAGHQNRVADLARAIGTEMHLPADTVEGIRMAGVIHDIGKISVPAEILSKPGKLSQKEFELIKDHPQTGYEVLKDVEFPWPIARIILQHHERLDGSGYPQGLKGEDMLLEARIIAVADVIEAIASHRPYRPARGIEAALAEIEQNKGVLYDASVVDACVKLFRERAYRLR
jgi:PAS domain S-box-containing protein